MDPDEKRIIRGVLFILLGVIFNLYLFAMLIIFFGFDLIISLSFTGMILLANAFILIGFFSIRPAKTAKGKMILGLTSMIFGLLIFLLPLIDTFIQISGINIAYQFLYLTSRILSISIYLIAGAILFVHGLFMFRRNYTSGMLKRNI